jgi:hypothetical protein
MSSLTHFFELALALTILIIIGIPLFTKVSFKKAFVSPEKDKEEYSHLLVRKEEVLISIKELDFDRKTDKISEDDYEILTRKLEDEALIIIEKIDQLEKKQKKGKPSNKQADAA